MSRSQSQHMGIISTSNKDNIVALATTLHELGWQIVATGGSSETIRSNSLPVTPTDDLTMVPTILGGRVKTLDPMVFGGLLYRRGHEGDEADAQQYQLPEIGLVACNFYPFVEKIEAGIEGDDLLQFIDVGGPAMIRAAAKNHPSVLSLVDPDDYFEAAERLGKAGGDPKKVDRWYKRKLAIKALRVTSAYDEAIASHLVTV